MVNLGLRAVGIHLGLLLGVIPVLVALGAFSLRLFYVLSLIGFLVVYELSTPTSVQTVWKRRLRYVTVLWVVGFMVLAAWQVVQIARTGI